LKERHGWRHLGVGDLGRLARRQRLPAGVSVRLMLALARSTPGEHIATSTASLLLEEVQAWRELAPVVVDGFPSLPEHVALLPTGSRVIHIYCEASRREQRLMARSEQTARRWTAGSASARDKALSSTIAAARTAGCLSQHCNDASVDVLATYAADLATHC
jgi:hypothetical protein